MDGLAFETKPKEVGEFPALLCALFDPPAVVQIQKPN